MTPYYEQDGITIYHGDCREVLPLVRADLLVTDPPYGMGLHHASRAKTPKQSDGNLWGSDWGHMKGDDGPFDPSHLLGFRRAVIWGANHFCQQLPSGRRWLVWNKGVPDGMSYSACELAWTSLGGGGVWHTEMLWSGFRRDTEVRQHFHPTQKPVRLMGWCLSLFDDAGTGSVVDPYMGSGTTLVAAKRSGRQAIGIELEEKYCEIAAKRLQQGALPMEFSA